MSRLWPQSEFTKPWHQTFNEFCALVSGYFIYLCSAIIYTEVMLSCKPYSIQRCQTDHKPQSRLGEPVHRVLQLGTGVAANELPVEGRADEGREEAGSHDGPTSAHYLRGIKGFNVCRLQMVQLECPRHSNLSVLSISGVG